VTRERVTLNLAAPLVIHPETRRGLQLVLDRGDWSARQPLAAAGASDAA
jgi:flagellar assembly factor FliW